MRKARSDGDLADFFAEASRAAEMAAACKDNRRLVPQLVELAEEILAWRNQPTNEADDIAIAEPAPLASSTHLKFSDETLLDWEKWQTARRRCLRDMELSLMRQKSIVQRLELIAGSRSAEIGCGLLRVMQDAMETVRSLSD